MHFSALYLLIILLFLTEVAWAGTSSSTEISLNYCLMDIPTQKKILVFFAPFAIFILCYYMIRPRLVTMSIDALNGKIRRSFIAGTDSKLAGKRGTAISIFFAVLTLVGSVYAAANCFPQNLIIITSVITIFALMYLYTTFRS